MSTCRKQVLRLLALASTFAKKNHIWWKHWKHRCQPPRHKLCTDSIKCVLLQEKLILSLFSHTLLILSPWCMHLWEQCPTFPVEMSGPILLTLSLQMFIYIHRVIESWIRFPLCLLQANRAQVSQPLLAWQMLQSPHHLLRVIHIAVQAKMLFPENKQMQGIFICSVTWTQRFSNEKESALQFPQ